MLKYSCKKKKRKLAYVQMTDQKDEQSAEELCDKWWSSYKAAANKRTQFQKS